MIHPQELKYSKSHEWVRVTGTRATIGITDFAQHELGDVVYLDLPAVGRTFQAEAIFGAVESVKAVSDLYAPVSGTVLEVNTALVDAPEGVNQSPYELGWMLVLELSDAAEPNGLLDAASYEALVAQQ
jgi:glycine cleavage system H protein